MRHLVAILAATMILGLSGLAHGIWTSRWQSAAPVQQAAARLACLPLKIGDWEGQDLPTLPRSIQDRVGFAGTLSRRYVNQRDGSELTILLVCGPPGPVATHPPEICLTGAGFEMATAGENIPVRYDIPSHTAIFNTAEFRKPGPTGQVMLVYWAWGASGDWKAPRYPRWAFAPLPVLYKLYVLSPQNRPGGRPADDAGTRFLPVLLDQLRACLFPASS